MVDFFEIHEKKIIKSLIYGFVIGLYLGILFHPGVDVRVENNTKIYDDLTFLKYTMDLLQTSVISSLLVLLLTLLYTIKKNK